MLKLGVLALLAPYFALAAVADSADSGFTVRVDLNIEASPQLVYARLVHNVGDWWSPMHTFTGDARNLSVDDKPMGCFCERRPNGAGGVRHLEVVNVDSGKTLVMIGALGPLQSMAATRSMTIRLVAAGEGTKVSVVYAVAGYDPHGMTSWAGIVDSVLTEQFARLKNFVETGKPENEKAAPK